MEFELRLSIVGQALLLQMEIEGAGVATHEEFIASWVDLWSKESDANTHESAPDALASTVDRELWSECRELLQPWLVFLRSTSIQPCLVRFVSNAVAQGSGSFLKKALECSGVLPSSVSAMLEAASTWAQVSSASTKLNEGKALGVIELSMVNSSIARMGEDASGLAAVAQDPYSVLAALDQVRNAFKNVFQ